LKTAIKMCLLVFLFFLDVHLNAESIFYPAGCWGKTVPCSVENETGRRLSLELKGMSIHLDSKAIVKAMSANEADLARGTLFAKHASEFQWHTPFGDVFCEKCQLILQRDEHSLEISALSGNVSVQRKGDSEKYFLPPGFSVTLSAVTVDGKADLEIPQAAPLRPTAKTWAKVYPGTVNDFKKDLGAYIESWRFAVETASKMHQEEADRRIAAAESDRERADRIRHEREVQNQKLRDLFRGKNYFQ
jgi:hypothetical protein